MDGGGIDGGGARWPTAKKRRLRRGEGLSFGVMDEEEEVLAVLPFIGQREAEGGRSCVAVTRQGRRLRKCTLMHVNAC